MSVDQRIVHWLRQKGDDVVHLRDQGLQTLPDLDIFEKAHSEQPIGTQIGPYKVEAELGAGGMGEWKHSYGGSSVLNHKFRL